VVARTFAASATLRPQFWYRAWLKVFGKYKKKKKKRVHLKNPIKIEEIQEKNLSTEIESLQLAF
jgi:hypothetical protein